MNASLQMQTTLANDAGVQATIDKYLQDAVEIFYIWSKKLLPKNVTDDAGVKDLDVESKTINHMPITNVQGGMPYIDLNRQVSCRAYTEEEAELIQAACYTALNRKLSDDKTVFFIADNLPVISPIGSDDNFNAPLSVRCILR